MDKKFNLNILTPEGLLFKGEARSVVLPGEEGYFGILADHAPLVSNLSKGRFTIDTGSDKSATINSNDAGFVEVLHNNVTILLNSAEKIS